MKRASRQREPIRRTPAMVLGDFLVLALLLTGLFFFQFNVYSLPGSRLVVLLVCLAASLLFLLVFSLPKYRWAAVLAVLALGAGLLFRYWDVVLQGAQAVYSVAAHVITESTGFPGEYPIPVRWSQAEIYDASNWFLATLIFALALPLGWAVVRRRAFFPVLLLTLPWLIPIFLAEFPPDVCSLSMVAAAWIARLLSGLTARGDPAGGARLTLAVLPAALLVLFCIGRIFPVETYVYPDWAANAAQKLTALGEQAAKPILSGGSGSGAAASVDLASCGPRRFSGRPVLRVESDWTGRLYLRGVAYADYTGESWEQLSDEARVELEGIGLDTSGYFVPTGMGAYSAAITHLDGSSWLAYYPYQPVNLADASYVADSYLRLEESQRTYTVEFNASYGLDRWVGDQGYRQFVYEHYLDVPEKLEETLETWWGMRQSLSPDLSRSSVWGKPLPTEAIDWIDGWLGRTAEYDLNTPVTPDGEDFVEYFLTEGQRGYCVHFASAAVLLLRQAGVPARYVSGYTVDVKNGVGTATDARAHAWVEYYVNGSGWYPLEVTPAAAFGGDAAGEAPPEQSVPAQEEPPEEKPSLSETPEPSDTPEAVPSEGLSSEGSGAADEKPVDLSWLLFAGFALALLGIPFLIRALRRRRWNRLTALKDHNRAVLEIYHWYQSLSPWGGKADLRLEDLARKAKFSQHTLTEEERREALEILRGEIVRLSGISSWKRPLFRYLFVWK